MNPDYTRLFKSAQDRWHQLERREQLALSLAAAVCALAVLWWGLLSPALHTLRFSATEHQRLDAQLRHMQQLQAQAHALRAQPPVKSEDARSALESSVQQRFGKRAQLSVVQGQLSLTLKSVDADALAQWLTQVRVNAHARIVEAHLTRSADSAAQASWNGTLQLALPER